MVIPAPVKTQQKRVATETINHRDNQVIVSQSQSACAHHIAMKWTCFQFSV